MILSCVALVVGLVPSAALNGATAGAGGGVGAASTAAATMPDMALMAFGALAMLIYAAAFVMVTRGHAHALRAIVVAWAVHALTLLVDVFGSGVGARFGFAPALSGTVWLVIAAHAVELRGKAPQPTVQRVLAIAGFVACALALVFPGKPHVAESPWAPLHWLLGIVSYGLFGAAVMHAWLLDRAERHLRSPRAVTVDGAARASGLPLLALERLTFRFVDAGFVVLSLALVLGVVFAFTTSAGWRWDHKTVLSLAGWVTFALLVVGRHAQGWRGRRATRWVYVGAGLLLLAYVGSRFVFEVLLGRGA